MRDGRRATAHKGARSCRAPLRGGRSWRRDVVIAAWLSSPEDQQIGDCIYVGHREIHDLAFPAGKASNRATTRRVGPLMFCVSGGEATTPDAAGSASGVVLVGK